MDKVIVGIILVLLTATASAAVTEPSSKNLVISILNSDDNSNDNSKPSVDPPDFSNSWRKNKETVDKLHYPDDHLYLSIIVGAGIAKIGKQQTDYGSLDYGMQYLPANDYHPSFLYGVNCGCEFKLRPNTLLSFGLGIYQNLNYFSKGQVWAIYALNPTENYQQLDYQYKLQSTRLMLETQLTWLLYLNNTKLAPFILLGAGPIINSSNSYQETPTSQYVPTMQGFKTKATLSVAYQIGFGIACPFNSNRDRLSIAYRYVDLGRAYFNSRESYSYNLEIGKTRTNEVYLSYTHLFGY